MLFAIADDVKIVGPLDVLADIVARVLALSMFEATNNRVYVQPSAREIWAAYLEANPRIADASILCLHDILERTPTSPYQVRRLLL